MVQCGAPENYSMPQHVGEYCNTLRWFLDTFDHPHQVKLLFVALVIAYHVYCYKLMRDFAAQRNTHSSKWFRAFNEVPSLLLIAIVILAVVKPG